MCLHFRDGSYQQMKAYRASPYPSSPETPPPTSIWLRRIGPCPYNTEHGIEYSPIAEMEMMPSLNDRGVG
jgi:hypothetical protein